MPLPTLTLYTTEHCHLCESAMRLLNHLGVRYCVADILDVENGLQHYGQRIPVVRHPAGRELDWPFSLLDLTDFIAQ